MMAEGCEKILIFPMYPQYSATTTASVIDRVYEFLRKTRWQPTVRIVPPYYDDNIYIDALKKHIEIEEKKKKFKFPVEWGIDLQSEHEKFLVEKHFKKPVIIVDYPAAIKAFYMRENNDGKTVAAMDILFPGIGEIVGGSQREERHDVLERKCKEFNVPKEAIWWYLDTRKFGTVPHAGFGLGFERLMMFVTGMTNIRDVIPFPRTPNNAEF